MSNLYALLIGIDHYFEYRLSNGLYYPRLGGCVRDINKVYSFLITNLDLAPENIIKLTATDGGSQPYEPETEWPTYRNMVNAFNAITERVQAGDQVYIQYSGHGGRMATMFPDLKGETAYDEGLAPLDIGDPNNDDARYLRDVEMYSLLQALVDKKVRLTVVFDCCHSGGATRDLGGARKRGIGRPDMSPPPSDSAVGDVADLVARWKQESGATTRAVQTQSSWLFEPKGYTLLAACRANESAFEFPFDGHESHGALTYWMIDTLGQSGPNTTWKMVADRVSAKVHGQFEQQTPMLQGEGEYRVFGAEKLKSQYAVPVLKVEPASRRVRLNAGEAHGLSAGTQFEVYPTTAEIGDAEKRLALVELTDVDAAESWAAVVEPREDFAVEEGQQAVMLNTSTVRVQRTVRVTLKETVLRQQVEAAIKADGHGFLTLFEPSGGADFLIDVYPESPGEFVIQDSGGNVVPHLNPPIAIDEEGGVARLVKRLVHLAQFRNVQMLDMPDSEAAAVLKVEVEGKRLNKPDDKFTVKITNTQEPNPDDPNDPTRVLNVTVLVLSSDWSVTQVYPEGAAPFQDVDPGETIPLEFEAFLGEGQTESLDIFKVFATRSTTNFRWLELPSLDEPIVRSATRSLSGDPLGALLAAATGEETHTRAVRLTSSPNKDKGWTVAQIEMVVTQDGQEPVNVAMPTASIGKDSDIIDSFDNQPYAEGASPTAQASVVVGQEIDARALGLNNPDEFQIYVEFPAPATLAPDEQVNARGMGDAASQLEQRSRNAIKAAMGTIKEMAMQTDLMRKGIPGGSQPRMVKVKFGISMDLQIGAFLTKSNAGATMEVELEWARRSDDVLRVLRAETDVDGALFTDAEGADTQTDDGTKS